MAEDPHGKTRAPAPTTAGAGQAVRIPIKGDKEIGGVELTHEATGVVEDEEETNVCICFTECHLIVRKSMLRSAMHGKSYGNFT